ncbi:hypothetical protein EYZ11_013476 [Aspergillus tanneri]|uniref:Uncharacterized protein n=1 Tax=Aspergillus tanneri TaxID=1220188 RepID=A0A4S3IZQ3_9EURO|nr:hypothetical protein EYZ11_013476 [Aspergillus tanneri]
MSFQPPKGRF